jgi:hypothetical protein
MLDEEQVLASFVILSGQHDIEHYGIMYGDSKHNGI